MALNSFGGGPGDVTANSAGDVTGGIILKVYTAALGGQRVTELYDLTGAPLAGVVVSGTTGDDEGRVSFQASDQYQILYLDSGQGMRWAIPAREAFSAASTALSKSAEALESARNAETLSKAADEKAAEALSKVGTYADLDIMKLDYQYVTQFRTPPARLVQSFGKNLNNGDYYAAQTVDIDASGRASTIIYRLSAAGQLISQSTLKWAGHGSSIDVEVHGNDVYIWTWWAQNSTGTFSGDRVVRWKYRPGVSVGPDDAGAQFIDNPMGDSYTTVGIDQYNDRIALRTGEDGSAASFYLYSLSALVGGYGLPIATLPSKSVDGKGSYQGHTTLGEHVYVAHGGLSGYPATITRYHWLTGEQRILDVSDATVNALGEQPVNAGEIEKVATWYTKDGKPVLLFGMGTGTGSYRQSHVYGFTPVGSADTGGDVVKYLNEATQAGRVLMAGGGGNNVSVEVKFKWEFKTIPTVVVMPESSVIGSTVLGASADNITTQGFRLWLRRTNTTQTGISWVAYDGPGNNGTVTL